MQKVLNEMEKAGKINTLEKKTRKLTQMETNQKKSHSDMQLVTRNELKKFEKISKHKKIT